MEEWTVQNPHKDPGRSSRGRGRGHGRGRGGRGRGGQRGSGRSSKASIGDEATRNVATPVLDIKPGKNHPSSTNRQNQPGKMTKTVQNPRLEPPTKTTTRNAPNSAIKSQKSVQDSLVKATGLAVASRLSRMSRTLPRDSGFFSLPGELRTRIYEEVFGTYRVEIIRDKLPGFKGQKPSRYRLYHKNLPLRHPDNHAVLPTKSASPPLALSLTCSKLYLETMLYLYSNTYFVFSSQKVIKMFLRRTAEASQGAIRHLELNHIMYNEPSLTEHCYFKCLSDMKWYLTCADMSEAFTSLRELYLDLAIADWPIKMKPEERWAWPLEFFRDLDNADITLHMGMFHEEKLRSVARELEKQIMKAEAWQIKDDERIARELMAKMGNPKARRVLNIIL